MVETRTVADGVTGGQRWRRKSRRGSGKTRSGDRETNPRNTLNVSGTFIKGGSYMLTEAAESPISDCLPVGRKLYDATLERHCLSSEKGQPAIQGVVTGGGDA